MGFNSAFKGLNGNMIFVSGVERPDLEAQPPTPVPVEIKNALPTLP